MTMTHEQPSADFRSADLALAAALCVVGFVIEEIEKTVTGRAVFIFNDTPELQASVDKYWRGEMVVDPQAYFNQLKILKSRIYER